ncbi:hypothetical protein J27TS8_41670 [Robertmurraya siralis]|uniref:Uncharacterized protein n=1 Tax=Robertmurraya siralis TaxID=77777 RepID=A0A920BVI3_9BACI|nr:hypothetical protein [Robertmurraya siralis]GIN64174.1 hypothetical protein J27TS8_41670 [Robertmurraya siralis]
MNIKIAVILCVISFIAIVIDGDFKQWQLGAFFVIVLASFIIYKKRHRSF